MRCAFFALMALLVAGFAGCGGSDSGGATAQSDKGSPASETKPTTDSNGSTGPSSTDQASSGAPTTPPATIEPRWVLGAWKGELVVDEAQVVDSLKQRAASQKENLTDDQIKGILQTLKSLKMNVKFVENGTMEMVAQMAMGDKTHSDTTKGSWQVIHLNGNKVTIRSQDAEKAEHEDIEIQFQSQNEFHMKPPAEFQQVGSMRFTRMR